MSRSLVLPALALVLAGSAHAAASERAAPAVEFFRTPSKNIACVYVPRAGSNSAMLRCDILSGLRPEPRARCQLDWTGVWMAPRGRARPTCAGDTANNLRARVLRYGQTWRRGGFTCFSSTSGLRCTNRARHGFLLSRSGWRIF